MDLGDYKMNNKNTWDLLIKKAKEVQNPRNISGFIKAGQVSAAILSKGGNIYTGVCIDTCSTLGICAERNAIHTMITNGEEEIDKIVCIMPNGKIGGSPCGACRELIMQLGKKSKEIEILINDETYETKKMEELIPDWWGTY